MNIWECSISSLCLCVLLFVFWEMMLDTTKEKRNTSQWYCRRHKKQSIHKFHASYARNKSRKSTALLWQWQYSQNQEVLKVTQLYNGIDVETSQWQECYWLPVLRDRVSTSHFKDHSTFSLSTLEHVHVLCMSCTVHIYYTVHVLCNACRKTELEHSFCSKVQREVISL
jgi:hypothetical protein